MTNLAKVIELGNYKEIRKKDRVFEANLSKSKKKAEIAVYAICAFIAIAGIALFLGVGAGIYYVWATYSKSDVLVLCAWYIIIATLPNLMIYNITEYIIGTVHESLMDNIKKNYNKFRRDYYFK